MSDTGPRKPPQDQSSGSGHTVTTSRHPYVTDPIATKRVCFYKSGDPQFSGLRMVVNNRTFKTFDALLDSLSKKVPLPFGVRNITTPRGIHAVHNLEDLEDGKAYICSDRRKVKPINLALASKKLPPWYHARPVSARRRVLQLARLNPDRPIRKKDPVVVRTPKRLIVFRNGDPSGKHTVMIQKRTTPTFEALLNYVSELMQFPVVKLHTPDGRRVDGLPALILCSGVVVAAGREAFKSENYKTQKPSAPTWLPPSRMASNRKKPVTRKNKSLSSGTKSRNFSASSERYFVNQIHNSIAGSLCDLHSNPTGSVELETSHLLESVAETEVEGEGGDMAPSDDIEKSFRVNQDGSMTVEMKVRLTIKEEETLHWTTTLTRSSVANQLSVACVAESEPETGSPDSNTLEQKGHNAMDTINRRNSKDDDDDDDDDVSPNENDNASEEWNEEDDAKPQTNMVYPRRVPTPGPRRFRQKQASVESIKSVTGEEIQENMVGSYSYRQETENGAVTEEYCMVKQCSTRPVPKPRRVGSVENNNYNNRAQTFKSTGVAEILQIEDSGEKVTETVLHIYEQQTCQDNFLANSQFSVQGVSMYGRPATSDTAHLFSSHDFEMKMGRPSTASESISKWRADNMSLSSDFTIPSLKAKGGNLPPPKSMVMVNTQRNPLSKPIKEIESSEFFSDTSKDVNKTKRMSSKPKVKKNLVRQSMTPDKKRKGSNADAPDNHKKGKPAVSSAASIRKIYGFRPKTVKSLIKQKKKLQENGYGSVMSKNSKLPVKTIKFNIENPNKLSTVKELNVSEYKSKTSGPLTKHVLDVSTSAEAEVKGTLKRQRSMHQERRIDRETQDLSESMSLPALNSSSSVINEYVEHWLEKAHPDPTVYPEEENQTLQMGAKRGVSEVSAINCEMVNETEEYCTLEEKTQILSCPSMEKTAFPNSPFENVATQRILSFENTALPPHPSSAKTPLLSEPSLQNSATITSAEKPPHKWENIPIPTQISVENKLSNSLSLENNSLPETISVDKPMLSDSPSVENTPIPIKISIENMPPSNNLSLEKTSPPVETPAEKTALSNSVLDLFSLASSPSYCMCSSPSSFPSEDRPSISPASEEAPSPTVHSLDKTISSNHSALEETSLPKKPSMKKARLVSNLSLEKKMFLRRASLEKSALTSDRPLENTIPSTPIKMSVEKTPLSNRVLDFSSLASSPICTSPSSLMSEDRPLSVPSSEEATSPTGHSTEETLSNQASSNNSTLKVPLSPTKPSVKRTQLVSKLSLEKKLSLRKAYSEKSELPRELTSENTQASSSPTLERTPLPRNRPLKTSTIRSNPSLKKKTLSLDLVKMTALGSLLSEKIPAPHNTLLQKRLSPYSQSLEVVSPPMKPRLKKTSLSINKSLDNTAVPGSVDLKKPPLPRNSRQTPLSSKSMPLSHQKTPTCPSPMLVNPEEKLNGDDELSKTDQGDSVSATREEPLTKTQITSHSFSLATQPDIKPVLDKLCFSIHSIRQITQSKRLSCLEKSNSLPDFSSHVASTFGSSSKVLLAFLSVMTLKEGIANLDTHELNANSVSCAEALKMMESLQEIARIEDADELKASLSDLQKSTSTQLLHSWRGFQELNDKSKSRSSTPNNSEHNLLFEACPEEDNSIDENVIDELINELDMPEKLKEELAALPTGVSIITEGGEESTEVNEKEQSSTEDHACHTDRKTTKGILSEHEQNALKEEEAMCTEEQIVKHTLSEEEQANGLTYNDGFVDKQMCPVEDKEKCENPSSSYEEEESLEEEQKCHTEDKPSHVEPKVKCTELQVSSEKSMSDPEEDQANSEEEQPVVKCMELQVNSEESVSTPDEDQARSEEELEYHIGDQLSHEEPEVKCMELQVSSEESRCSPEVDQPNLEEEQENQPSNVKQVSSVEEEQASSEEEQNGYIMDQQSHEKPEVECIESQVSGEESVSTLEGDSEEENQPSNVKQQVSGEERESTPEEDQASSEEEKEDQPSLVKTEVKCIEQQVSNEKSMSGPEEDQANSEDEQPVVKCIEQQVSSEERDTTPDKRQASSEEVQECHIEDQPSHEEPKVKCMELQVSSEERDSTSEEDKTSLEEESHADYFSYADVHLSAEEEQTSQEESQYSVREMQSRLIEEQATCVNQQVTCLTEDTCLIKEHPSNADTAGKANFGNMPCSSEEEQVSYTKKQYSFEKEHVSMEKPMQEEGFAEYQERYIEEETSEEDANYEMTDEKSTNDLKESLTQSVAERVSLLEKQVAAVDQRKNVIMETSGVKQFAQMEVPYTSESDDLTHVSRLSNEQVQVDEFMRGTSEINTIHYHIKDDKNRDEVPVHTYKKPTWPINTSESLVMSKKSTLESSSLAFSYDSSRCLTIEPEGNRVKSIKEMFLAKSVVDIQHGQIRLPSPNTSDLSDYRPETSDSGGHRSQTSTELSSGEDDSVHKSITKGFVRRTIERLYGKRDTEGKEHDSERPPSVPKLKLREIPGKISLAALSPFSLARTKVKSDLSYFNATSSFETNSEETRRIAFNAQVGPRDSVPIDQGRWLIRENNQIRKSISEPTGINKNTETSTNIENACEDTKEDIPYSLFGPESLHTVLSSDLEDKVKPVVPKCTYFNLRQESDSDLCQDELSTVSSSDQADVSKDNKDTAEDPKMWAEKNGMLPDFVPTEFKMLDNKVHPLVEAPGEGQVVVVQPGKGQQKQTVNKTTVNKRPQEPDALEMLYLFCGQHCPVL